MVSQTEIKKRAIEFQREYSDVSDEKSYAQSFWRDFFGIWGLTTKRIGVFEARAKTIRDTVGFVDFFWPGTMLVGHKSRGEDLDKAIKQALDYCSKGIKDEELPKYIIVSDFARFRILEYSPETGGYSDPAEFPLEGLHENLHRFNFILGYEQRKYKEEDPVNIKAAELMGALHDELKENGYAGHELELFLVRLMFCFFADDTGIFPKDQFSFLAERTREDGGDLGPLLGQAFQVLNTAPAARMKNLDPELDLLPYVNGGLFQENLPLPSFDAKMRQVFIHCCLFDWSRVSPAIFGSLFQSVMDAKERRSLGAHYTSEKNILKTVHGLFLDELQEEVAKARGNGAKCKALLKRIAGIRMLDPACGCGNFLILAYRELRLLEIELHKEIQRIDKQKYMDLDLYRGIDVENMYGIEIEEFPAQIARTALWIMDHLMNVRLSQEFGEYIVRLPLTSTPHIVQANALRMDWNDLVPPEKLSYIFGNPPFVGHHYQNEEQKRDQELVMHDVPSFGILDYVANWYVKACRFIKGNDVKCALVSTNSITQGEQAGLLWRYLFSVYNVKILFAHRTFVWDNEASGKAHVHVVIIGFGSDDETQRIIYDYPDIKSEPVPSRVHNISPYLTPGTDTVVVPRTDPICKVPRMLWGNKPTDGGHFILTATERDELISIEPGSACFLRQFMGGADFIKGEIRYCLWLKDANISELRKLPKVMERVEAVKRMRLESKGPVNYFV